MSTVLNPIAVHVTARAVVASKSTRGTSVSSSTSPRHSAQGRVLGTVHCPGVSSLNRHSFRLMNAVAAPVAGTAPGDDPFSAFCAEQMLDEVAMIAASAFPISPAAGEKVACRCRFNSVVFAQGCSNKPLTNPTP